VVSRFTELEQFKNTISKGNWWLVLAALFTQCVYYVVFAWTYKAAFSTVDIPTRTLELIPVTLGSLFINVVVPAGGAGGAALFAEDLSKRGKPAARVAAGALLQLITDFAAFTLLLIPGMVYLFSEHDLKIYEIFAAVVLLFIITGLSSILLVGILKPAWLYRLFCWLHRTANWILKRFKRSFSLADDWPKNNADEFNQAAAAVASHPTRLAQTVAIHLLAHLTDIGMLYILFQAFNQPIGFGALIAGYAVGILFLVVSITPQGIGVVEGMMTLVFTSLGIPGAVAATVTLAYRGLTFWIPLLLGFFAVQHMHNVGANRGTLTEMWGVRFASFLVALMGVVNVISAVTPSLASRVAILEQYSPLEVRHGSHLTAALSGFALLLLSSSLARRKHIAWMLALGVLALSILSHLFKGLDYEEALLAAGLMIMLWLMRAHFHARSDPPSVLQGSKVLAGAFLFTLAYGVAGFYLLDRHYSVNFGFGAAAVQTIVMFTQFYDPGFTPLTQFGRYFADSIYLVGAATFGYAGFMLLRPVFLRSPATSAERKKASQIVEQYGNSSLARCLIFDDKRYLFSQGGSVVGYALIGRSAVALGDPIGPQNDIPLAIQAFSTLCQRNDWLPIFYHTMPDFLTIYKQSGFEAIRIGEEGIVILQNFSLEGKSKHHMRSAINKLNKTGYKFIVYEPPISDELLAELRSISDEWLTNMHGSEKKFSLGWFDDDYIRSSQIGAVLTPDGWISAFANIVPEYQLNEISIDLMRHRKAIENATMEYLFISMFQWAKTQGYHSFNLGLSSLYGVGNQADDPMVEKVMHWIYENVNQFYNFKGLHKFKEKFDPEWSPRYLIYRGSSNLIQSWLAVVQANSGSGSFLFDYLIERKRSEFQHPRMGGS
jgi:phosphatidylglycerol lysyltransferase